MIQFFEGYFPLEVPSYHLILEGFLMIWVLWFLMRKKNKPDSVTLTHEEEEQIISHWKPKPLVEHKKKGPLNSNRGGGDAGGEGEGDDEQVWGPVEGRIGKFVTFGGISYLNMASHNYLGLVEEPALEKEAERCIRKYGVGSCGPRGFYGSVDVHLKLEERIASFLNLEETALYSYGFSTIASAIPSYSKAGDIIFADEKCNFAIQKGVQASRSNVHWFRHNDFKHLEQLLDKQVATDRKNPGKAKTTRRFCVVEGIYSKTGEMCPLNEIAALCRKHKVRLFVDEDLSIGVLGKTGRGITEHLGVPMEDIDLISGSLEHAFAAFGGFIVGPTFVVDHQRISGLGYCFSASLPPLLAGVGIAALDMLEKKPQLVEQLQENCIYLHKGLEKLTHLKVTGHELSPVKNLVLKQSYDPDDKNVKFCFHQIVKNVKKDYKIAIVEPSILEKQDLVLAEPSIRLTVNRLLTQKEMDFVVEALEKTSSKIFSPSRKK